MKKLLAGTTAALALMTLPQMAAGADVALLVGNGNYDFTTDLRGAADIADAQQAFEALGFEVFAATDADGAAMLDLFDEFVRAAEDADRVLVVLAGRYMHSATDSWLLASDMGALPSLARLPSSALSLNAVLAVTAGSPGKALVILAGDAEAGPVQTPFLERGTGALALPQGVTLLQGSVTPVADFVTGVLPMPGMGRTILAASRQGLRISGYAPEDYEFLGSQVAAATPAVPQAPDAGGEDVAWQRAALQDSLAGYQFYLSQFPDGVHAAEANRMITEIRTEPFRAARKQEDALALSREDRREIQRNLSILDFNPRGIDGIFGPGSRAAIAAWQGKNGLEASGFVSREQVTRLEALAERRSAELEAEAERLRLEQEQADRTYWQATGAAGDEIGLRTYLRRYPDGVFAEVAQDRLDAIEQGKREAAAAQERTAWDNAVEIDSIAAYQGYLAAYPNGAFAGEAGERIAELQSEADQSDALESARLGEERLQLSQQTRRVIENRLNELGFKPGQVDGVFDDRSRRAIRRFQQSRKLRVTGYLDQETTVRLLAGTILR